MKIAVDISQIVFEGTGVGRYTKNLINAFCTYETGHDYTFFCSSLRRTMPESIKALIEKKHRLVQLKLPSTFLSFLWNQLHQVPIELFIGKHDVVISSDWTQPPTSAKKITIVHDLIAYKYPNELHPKTEFFFRNLTISPNIVKTQKRRLNWVKKEVDSIVVDSQATKDDLIEVLNISQDKIHVIYPAIEIKEPSVKQQRAVIQKYKLHQPFVLSVGKVEPRKNLPRLIEAFDKLEKDDIDLVIVGTTGWDQQLTDGVKPNIKYLGYVPDEDLYALYSRALCFIMPSLYEGFGYPLVEAMRNWCPVGASNVSSMKEIVKDVGILFDPLSTQSITRGLKQLIENSDLRRTLARKGRKRSKDFSLERFTREFMRVINS
ncbi:hypothetical protein A2690_02520 [Candidatus Roizmanbacteria bacterium RIFCSPHIGHO2_01_FULL_39_12b]|uniref:Glycosyl transferase family 1 domain-containing protein n=1 Tax=Candidatus Roizmanbacteria bacterium RIFCSPHIGHO2_01_FULL_39_12b TaxID=1802030 RepID=A0A1F7GEY5_9BACT|nr:MAG: hypothetical protein A2690_02520 [Candidatus Roizmanbacteria bacterium RIFCSPHIGHO2_01_FULL_39_12b]OGK46627.1 MAG: hypothetical protein A3B46_00280 [Candidatus Roizmanbacteria bacterium RIFCSPLOWO2_01_FULL_39_19]